MSPALREVLGFITLVAILWDTIMTAVLLKFAISNRSHIAKLEQHEQEQIINQRTKRVQVSDITSIVEAVSALATAVLTTYTLINLIRKGNLDAKSKPNSGIRDSSPGPDSSSSSDSNGKSNN